MFVFQRSLFAVISPLALLLAVAWWSNHTPAVDAPRFEAQDATNPVPREITAERQPDRTSHGAGNGRT